MTTQVNITKHHVAIVDDDLSVARATGRILTIGGYTIRLFTSAEEFLADSGRYDCVVLDVELPGMSGIEVEQRLRAANPRSAVVFFTACSRMESTAIVHQTGRLCVRKPADGRLLLEAVAHAIEAAQAKG